MYLQTNALDVLTSLKDLTGDVDIDNSSSSTGSSISSDQIVDIWSVGDTHGNAIMQSMSQLEENPGFVNVFMTPDKGSSHVLNNTNSTNRLMMKETQEKVVTTLQLVNIVLLFRVSCCFFLFYYDSC